MGDNTTIPNPLQKKKGLFNFGNTCYANSVLQALMLTKNYATATRAHQSKLWDELAFVFVRMAHSKRLVLDVDPFKKLVLPVHFRLNAQQDSSEFLVYLLSSLKEEEVVGGYLLKTLKEEEGVSGYLLNSLKEAEVVSGREHESEQDTNNECVEASYLEDKSSLLSSFDTNKSFCVSEDIARVKDEPSSMAKSLPTIVLPHQHEELEATLVQEIFGGVQITSLKCLECDVESIKKDEFRELHLNFSKKFSSIQNLVDAYCTAEMLWGNNCYRCETCGDLKEGLRKVTIEEPPCYLIAVLDRFTFNSKSGMKAKLMGGVHLTRVITTSSSNGDCTSYHLYAVIVHIGTMLDSGHYVAYGKDQEHWYLFNDETVEISSDVELDSLSRRSTPYMLFYRRQDIVEDSEPPPLHLVPHHLAQLIRSDHEFLEQEANESDEFDV